MTSEPADLVMVAMVGGLPDPVQSIVGRILWWDHVEYSNDGLPLLKEWANAHQRGTIDPPDWTIALALELMGYTTLGAWERARKKDNAYRLDTKRLNRVPRPRGRPRLRCAGSDGD